MILFGLLEMAAKCNEELRECWMNIKDDDNEQDENDDDENKR